MAKRISRKTGKSRSTRRPTAQGGRSRVLAGLALVLMVGGVWGWWHLHHWTPDRARFPVQGVEVGADDGELDWPAVKAVGVDFVYVDASAGAFTRDPAMVANLDGARGVGLQVGALHTYDPCQPADRQSANFVTVVPRDRRMLPPAVELVRLGDDCPVKVLDAAVISELIAFINQIEAHAGKAVLLKVGPAFEARYHIARALPERNLWLTRDRFEPDYAGRPWTIWTANAALSTKATDRHLRWLVVQP
ncbi:lysozyme [Novosphingobium sp. FSY-8]|uniref:Lysozyme n=1 Tax=Novosphingobium ovatum TaxID=1908523 RepID=A0ABW9XE16_9SPHN|nr:glycoside hydrolase family 25 protein [Novosphingobium ovatum]NBC36692.1 lysozyme [Novosphingobium ovatum]